MVSLGLGISLSKKPAVMFPGGADLYGSAEFPGTLTTLAPGDSLRVLARVALPEAGVEGHAGGAFIASASLNHVAFRTVNGEILLESQNVGSATSSEYTATSLLGRHE